MAPTATATLTRGRGRPRKDAAPASGAVAVAPKRRGRAAAPVEPEPQPKRRGRAAQKPVAEVSTEIYNAVEETSKRASVRGRPRKEPVVEDAPAPTTQGRRSRKQEAVVEEPAPTPKRRGRPPKNAIDLNRVAGSPCVTKRTAPRATTTSKTATAAPAPRLNARLRSKLRPRVAPVEKKAPVVEAPKAQIPKPRIGRPPKNQAAVAPPTKPARVAKTAPKPRKRRGITVREIPDQYVAQIDDYLRSLIEADAANASKSAPEEPAEPVEDTEKLRNGEAEGYVADEESLAGEGATIEEQDLQELNAMKNRLALQDMDEQDMEDMEEAEPKPAAMAGDPLSVAHADQTPTPSSDSHEDDQYVAGDAAPATEAVVLRENVEIEMEVDKETDDSLGAEEPAAADSLVQQEIAEEFSVMPSGDEPDSLFDATMDDSIVGQPMAASAPVAQMMATAFAG